MNNHPITSRNVWNIAGLPFDVITLDQSVAHVQQAIKNKSHLFFSTPNLNFLIAIQSDNQFFQSVVDSNLSVADGMPLIWIAKILGVPITVRVAGSTLFDELSKQTGGSDKSKVFFFGGQAGVAAIAHQQLNKTSQGMISCGYYDPGFVSVESMSSPEIIEKINAAEADFLVVALGAKKGQQWIQKNRGQLNAKVISHLGAVINFVAGHVERAPLFWQRCGLEWLWRIRQEPELWRRYLFDGLAFLKLLLLNVIPLAIYDRWLKRTNDYRKPIDLKVNHKEGTLIAICGSLAYTELASVKQMFSEVIIDNKKGNIELDCRQITYIDGAFIATLLLFQRYLNEQGCQLYLAHLPCRIKWLLKLNDVLKRFKSID